MIKARTSSHRAASAVIAALIAVLILLAFASCAQETQTPDNTSAAVTTATTPESNATSAATDEVTETPGTTEPDFNTANYGGEDFTVFIRINTFYSAGDIYAEDQTGDVLNDSVWRRNLVVEDKYNIHIKVKTALTPYTQLDKDVAGGAIGYDMILDRRSDLASCSVAGLLYDFNKLGVDYSRPWWDDNAKGYEIAGRQFLMPNDVDTGNLAGARFLYFNKELIKSFRLEDPYELVQQNQWTLDKYLTLVKNCSEDRGSNQLGVYGMITETGAANGNHMHLLIGCGVQSTATDSDGKITQLITGQLDKISDVFDQLNAVFNDRTHARTYQESAELFTGGGYTSVWTRGRGAFAAGHYLFVQGGMDLTAEFADMQDDYGLVPNPKYNGDQENYYHKIDRFAIIWGIPNSPAVIDLERVANVSDYWAYVSSYTVMPAYYEITVKTRRFKDPTASDMLDIVKGSLVYDVCDIYGININESLNNAYVNGNIGGVLSGSYLRNVDNSITSLVKSINQKYSD